MRYLALVVTLLLLSACSFMTDDSKDIARDELSSKSRYSINSCYDEIVEYRLYDKTYTKIFYLDDSFSSIEKEINDKVEYKDSLNITLYQDSLVIDCSIKYEDNDIVILYCRNREYKDKKSYYDIPRTLYPSKKEAIANRDKDCN